MAHTTSDANPPRGIDLFIGVGIGIGVEGLSCAKLSANFYDKAIAKTVQFSAVVDLATYCL